MKILEVTNASNIGSYKNMPNIEPIEPRKHNKPIKGSYKQLISKSKVTENRQLSLFLNNFGYTEDEIIQIIYGRILQDSRWDNIVRAVDNDKLSAASIDINIHNIQETIKNEILPIYSTLYIGRDDPLDLTRLFQSKRVRFILSDLNQSLEEEFL